MVHSVNVYDKFKQMENDNLMMTYQGVLNGEMIAAILQLSDSKLKEQEASLRKKKTIINILIECLQNIFYHGQMEAIQLPCVLMMGKDSDQYFIWTGNYVANSSVASLKSKLDKTIILSKEELHALYLQTLDTGQLSDKGGAGLGLLRILRESGQKVHYSFDTVNDNFSFFSLQISIGIR